MVNSACAPCGVSIAAGARRRGAARRRQRSPVTAASGSPRAARARWVRGAARARRVAKWVREPGAATREGPCAAGASTHVAPNRRVRLCVKPRPGTHRGALLVLAAFLAEPEVQVVVKPAALDGDAVEANVRVADAQAPTLRLLALLHGLQRLDAPHLEPGLLARAGKQLCGRHGAWRARKDAQAVAYGVVRTPQLARALACGAGAAQPAALEQRRCRPIATRAQARGDRPETAKRE